MASVYSYILLIAYLSAVFVVGYCVLQKLVYKIPTVLMMVGSLLLGLLVVVPVTYVTSTMCLHTSEPLLWGMTLTIIMCGGFVVWMEHKKKKDTKDRYVPIGFDDALVVIVSLIFSSWMAWKTFHGNAVGEIFVGSNNIFDFSHSLGIIRSFSFGGNIPFTSPFQSGLPFFYHYFFYFFVALWEYLGVPIVLAVNIVSVLSFTLLLLIIYYVPQMLFRSSKGVGWLAMLLTITNSTLTWWKLLVEKGISLQTIKSIWSLPTYPYAGPFDGSIISIFMTLNNYMNQRHLAFGIASTLFLVLLVVQMIEKNSGTVKRTVLYGTLFGLVGLWNIPIAILGTVVVFLLLMLKKKWKEGIAIALVAALVMCVSYWQYLISFRDFVAFGSVMTGSQAASSSWNTLLYLWLNLGILPFLAAIGFAVLPKKQRIYGLPFLIISILFCVINAVLKRGFDQKFLSFLIIPVNVFASYAIWWVWEKRTLIHRVVAIGCLGILTVSGIIDLMPIKNEFAYPLVDSKTIPVISWIKKQTPKSAIFVSYADMIDPVVFAGRKNYFGFFGNMGWQDRSKTVKDIYAGDLVTARSFDIAYILVPRWTKNDFPYTVDTQYFEEHNLKVYEDERYTIYSTVIK